jgi:uncharacterized damage-inducible protein DinB
MDALGRFLSGWEKVRQNTLACAQDLPEEHYETAPFEGMWSFRKQVGHILNVEDVLIDGLEKRQFDPAKFAADSYRDKTKAELVAALEGNLLVHKKLIASHPPSFWDEPRKSFDGSDKTAGELLQMLKEHEIAHCNQMYLYLRSKGVVPPTTRKRAEAKAAAGKK